MKDNAPDIYLSVDDESFVGSHNMEKCSPTKIAVSTSLDNDNILTLDLSEWGATARLGDGSDIVAVRVSLRDSAVYVNAIYHDPMKTVIAEYCCGSGCCCTAHRCFC